MGGSTDAFALYLSLFQVSRPSDASKPSTSLAFHKEAESKFEFGTSTLKPSTAKPEQEELMSHEQLKADLEQEKERDKVVLETEEVQAHPSARNGQRLGGGAGEEAKEEGEKPSMRELAVRAAEKRAQAEKEGLKAGEVKEVQIRAQPAA